MKIDLDLIDTRSLFDDLNIEYKDSGKNISNGWLGIDCPYCGDSSNHLGLNLSNNLFSCWRCSERGTVVKLVKEIKQISYHQANLLMIQYQRDGIFTQVEEQNPTHTNVGGQGRNVLVWPNPILDSAPELHRRYLQSRNFDPDFLTKKYGLRFTPNTGPYRFRIIAPMNLSGKAVSWIAADIIRNKERIPYLKCPVEMSIVNANSCLYNIDSVKDVAVICEGITDCWRIGDGSVATLTKNVTSEQTLLLTQRGVRKVLIMFDSDALEQAHNVARRLSGLFKTEVIELSEGDPADFNLGEVSEVRKLLK